MQYTLTDVKTTFQIAKDMERWAKNVNAAKSVQQQQLQAVIEQERNEVVITPPVTYADSVTSVHEIKRTGVPLAAALHVVRYMDVDIIGGEASQLVEKKISVSYLHYLF